MALRKLHRQEAPNSVGGRKSMYQIKATVAKRLDMIATAAAGHAIYIYLYRGSQDHHTTASCLHPRKANAEGLQDLTARTSSGGFQQDLHKIFSEGPRRDRGRTPQGCHQDLFKSFSQGPAQIVQGHAKAPDSMPLGSPQASRKDM